MIKTKEDLKDFLSCELKKYNVSRLKTLIPIDCSEKQILGKYIVLLRKCEYLFNNNKKIRYVFKRFKLNRYRLKYSIHIPLNCFDKGLHIMHLGPILVNGNAKVGKNCSIHINTSIVAGGLDSGCPTIGDSVVIGVGAVLLGDIKVADYVAIGANSVVNKDVIEENIAIAGVPAKKISNNGSKEWNKDYKELRK